MSREPYCKPLNAGLASETQAVTLRLAKLFRAMDDVNAWIVAGPIVEDIRTARNQIRDRLEAEGWVVTYQTGQLQPSNRCRVFPPGSPSGQRILADRAKTEGSQKP